MSNWLPSLNALRAFEAVSRHLSYREAADELHVTPAAVKQLVQKLEESLNTKLVRRHGRGIALTKTGLEGVSELHLGFKQLSSAVGKMRETQTRQSLTITAEPSFAITWLVKRIDSFKRAHPEIDVLIDSSLRVMDLKREPMDVAIRYGVEPSDDQICHRLFNDETLAVCSKAVAEGPPKLKSLSDLQNVPLIHIGTTYSEWSPIAQSLFDWNSWFKIVGVTDITPGPGLHFNDYNLAIQAAIAGQGVVLGSWPLVKDAVEVGLLVAPFEEYAKTGVGYDLVTTNDAMKKPEVAAFVEWILEEIKR